MSATALTDHRVAFERAQQGPPGDVRLGRKGLSQVRGSLGRPSRIDHATPSVLGNPRKKLSCELRFVLGQDVRGEAERTLDQLDLRVSVDVVELTPPSALMSVASSLRAANSSRAEAPQPWQLVRLNAVPPEPSPRVVVRQPAGIAPGVDQLAIQRQARLRPSSIALSAHDRSSSCSRISLAWRSQRNRLRLSSGLNTSSSMSNSSISQRSERTGVGTGTFSGNRKSLRPSRPGRGTSHRPVRGQPRQIANGGVARVRIASVEAEHPSSSQTVWPRSR